MNPFVRVWDLPVRLFHWLFAASFTGAWITAESERWRDLHVAFGYGLGALLAFRLIWGFIGGRYARFRSFAYGPRRVVRYLRSLAGGTPEHYIGHNPAGSVVIYALLLLGFAATATGLAAYNDVGGHFVEEAHEAVAGLMLGLAGIHVAGVLVASVLHRENLVRSMITGRKTLAQP